MPAKLTGVAIRIRQLCQISHIATVADPDSGRDMRPCPSLRSLRGHSFGSRDTMSAQDLRFPTHLSRSGYFSSRGIPNIFKVGTLIQIRLGRSLVQTLTPPLYRNSLPYSVATTNDIRPPARQTHRDDKSATLDNQKYRRCYDFVLSPELV